MSMIYSPQKGWQIVNEHMMPRQDYAAQQRGRAQHYINQYLTHAQDAIDSMDDYIVLVRKYNGEGKEAYRGKILEIINELRQGYDRICKILPTTEMVDAFVQSDAVRKLRHDFKRIREFFA